MRRTHRIGRKKMLPVLMLGVAPVIGTAGSAAPPPAAAPASLPSPSAGVIDITKDNFPWQFEKTYTRIESGPWRGARTPDGQPDVQGSWSNTIANHNNFTDPQGGIPGNLDLSGRRREPRGPRSARAPSRVTDPADGQVPLQPWAQAKVEDFRAHFWNPTAPQYVEPLERCAPAGIPKSFYFVGYEIRQYPHYVVFFFETGSRVIYLDDRPHLPDNVKLWNGDSRGHWEGNTLVVDVRNLNGKALFGRSGEFFSENATVREKYIFAGDGLHYTYEAVITDPTVFTRPFTVTIPQRKWTQHDKPNEWAYAATAANPRHPRKEVLYEPKVHECVENNDGFALGSVTER